MRRLLLYLVAVCLLMSCVPEIGVQPQLEEHLAPELEGKPVVVNFSVPNVPVSLPTKSEDGDIGGADYLHPDKFFLVVCGHSQSIKYIRKAECTGTSTISSTNFPHYPFTDPNNNITLYHFRAFLELSDSDRTIHFLGNIDESQLVTGSGAYEVLPTLLSEEGKQAYWQTVTLSHIIPKRKPLDPSKPEGATEPVINDDGFYELDDNLKDTLSYVPLIRNFAKIRLSNSADNFSIYSYAVVHQPKNGSVVPYRSNVASRDDKFVFKRLIRQSESDENYQFSGYELCNFDYLDGTCQYPGHLPDGVELDINIPKAEKFETPESSGGKVIRFNANDKHQGFYIYERGIPSNTIGPTFIIIRGAFTKDNNGNAIPEDEWQYYYYRLDLMETRTDDNDETFTNYFPIYRNFLYDIDVNRVTSLGAATPEEAAESSGADDISADPSMTHLSDISNGTTRLVVEPFMAQTYTGPSENGYELLVRFFNDLASDVPNTRTGDVIVELEPILDEFGEREEDILELYDDQGIILQGNEIKFFPAADVDGFRHVRFNTKQPGLTAKTQKIKITGKKMGNAEALRLYREVEITLQNKQPMTAVCVPSVVAPKRGVPVTMQITIPGNLPESMFPLDFVIESVSQSLTPNTSGTDNNLPVITEASFRNSKLPTFKYVRTVTLEEYKQHTSGGDFTFNCDFKTSKNISATEIIIDNKYFNRGYTELTNTVEPTNHFFVEAQDETCIVKINKNNIEYRIDAGEWKANTANQEIEIEAGHRVSFRAKEGVTITGWHRANQVIQFSCTKKGSTGTLDGKFKVGGNIASLIVGDRYVTMDKDIPEFYFESFFKNNINLTDASMLELPMMNCSANCYKSMFEGCSSLIAAPKLPATKMNNFCYRNMFWNCTSLTEAPELPAETLAKGCYQRIFCGCTSLQSIKIKCKTYREDAFVSDGTTWVGNVPSGGTIWIDPAVESSANYNASAYIPAGWTTKRYGVDD